MLCNFQSHFLVAEKVNNFNSCHSSGIRSLKDFPKYGKAYNVESVIKHMSKMMRKTTLFISRTCQKLYLLNMRYSSYENVPEPDFLQICFT